MFRPFLIVLLLVTSALPSSIAAPPTDFVKTHCFDCHQGNGAEAGLDLQAISSDLTQPESFDNWVKVFDRIKAGEMPPKDSSQPTPRDRSAFLKEASDWLGDHQRNEYKRLGRVRGRRLTNKQLERTLQDLLGIDIPLATEMPDEPRTEGFTTVASGQAMSHFQLQTHLSVVDRALDEAFRRALKKPDEWKKSLTARDIARRNPNRRCREPEMLDGKAVVWSGKTTFYGRLPVTTAREEGWYRLKVKASALNVPKDHGVWCTVRTGMCVSSAPMLTWSGAFEATEDVNEWTFEAWLPRGHMFEVRPGDDTLKMGRFQGGQIGTGEGTPQNLCGLAIHSAELERIHKGPGNWQIRRYLFGDLELKWGEGGKNVWLKSSDRHEDAARLMTTFAERAFRRPVSEQNVAPFVALVHKDLENEIPLAKALLGGYRAIFCSPRFTHFHEQPGQLDDFALASRLSYFLWGTMPDKQLRHKAAAGELRDRKVLQNQARRLLDDPRGNNFVKDLAHEWLDLSEIDFTEPDRKLYRGFDVIVQQAMLAETHSFLQEMLDSNLSVGNVIDSDFTFLNSRLARYYGIDGVSGDEVQRVVLPENSNRGGLLTHGSILKVTANGTDTSPVLRGVWVSERLLGTDIPPPPENVPAIEPDIRGATTIREMLQKHKSVSECASCHVKIDPPGFALENFDPSGRWRDRYIKVVKRRLSRGSRIDASFDMPDGQHFDDLKEFQKLVLQDKEALAQNVVRKLITYGTGAAVGFADRSEVESIVRQCKGSDYGFRSLVLNTISSSIFGMK